MRFLFRYIILLIILTFFQIFIVRHIEIGYGAEIFLLPIFIMILPLDLNIFVLMGIAFLVGFVTDIFMHSYGLNASSLVLFAYLKPIVFKFFHPKEGYDNLKFPTIPDIGIRWFVINYSLLLGLHNLWFFTLEIYKINEWSLVLRNTCCSFLVSFIVALIANLFIRLRYTK